MDVDPSCCKGFGRVTNLHERGDDQTSDGIVFVQGVLDAGDDAARGVSSLVGKGDHVIISIFNQAPIMQRLATTRISGTLPSCSPPKSISSNPRFGFGKRSIRRLKPSSFQIGRASCRERV